MQTIDYLRIPFTTLSHDGVDSADYKSCPSRRTPMSDGQADI